MWPGPPEERGAGRGPAGMRHPDRNRMCAVGGPGHGAKGTMTSAEDMLAELTEELADDAE